MRDLMDIYEGRRDQQIDEWQELEAIKMEYEKELEAKKNIDAEVA